MKRSEVDTMLRFYDAAKEQREALQYIYEKLTEGGKNRQHVIYSDALHPSNDDKTIVDYIEEVLNLSK